MKKIESSQNPLIKYLVKLQEKTSFRKKEGKFLIEGIREIQLAIEGNYTILKIVFCATIIDFKLVQNILPLKAAIELIEVSADVYHKLAYRSSTEGVIAVAESKNLSLSNLQFISDNPLIIIAESPEKPGNIGALLRTADAANTDAVIIANPKTDVYNPNIIRSSVGCLFTNQLAVGTTDEIIKYLKKSKFTIYCSALTASKSYHLVDYTKKSALVVGTESTGLSKVWLDNSSQNIIIPMNGKIDSLNVSVSAAIIIFEAKRQRNFNKIEKT